MIETGAFSVKICKKASGIMAAPALPPQNMMHLLQQMNLNLALKGARNRNITLTYSVQIQHILQIIQPVR